MTFSLLPASSAAPIEIELLLDAAFGAGRHAKTTYRLRAGVDCIDALSFVVRDERGALAGSIQLWPILLVDAGGEAHPLTLVGPVAVAPAFQGAGVGTLMMQAALSRADAHGRDALLLVGDPEYYARFGFAAGPAADWSLPGPVERRRVLARLSPAARARLPAYGRLRAFNAVPATS